MINKNLYTVSNIADILHEPPQRVAYIIRKYRLLPVRKVGITRLFSEEQAKAIEQELFQIQVRPTI